MAEQVCEPIKAVVYFTNSSLSVLKFKWNDRIYKVDEMMQSWRVPKGDTFRTHYIVKCNRNNLVCELSFDHRDLKWQLVQYMPQ